MVIDLPGVAQDRVDGGANTVEAFVPFTARLHDHHLVENEIIDIAESAPVFLIAKESIGIQHADQHLGLLPELLFSLRGGPGHRHIGIHPSIFRVDAQGQAVIELAASDVGVSLPGNVQDIGSMQQQPGKLNVVPRRGLVEGRSVLGRAGIPAPLCCEDDPAQRLEVVGELDVSQPGFRMQQAGDDQVNDLLQAAAVRRQAGHLVKRGQRFHHVHVHVERLPIPAVFARRLGLPVAA